MRTLQFATADIVARAYNMISPPDAGWNTLSVEERARLVRLFRVASELFRLRMRDEAHAYATELAEASLIRISESMREALGRTIKELEHAKERGL